MLFQNNAKWITRPQPTSKKESQAQTKERLLKQNVFCILICWFGKADVDLLLL